MLLSRRVPIIVVLLMLAEVAVVAAALWPQGESTGDSTFRAMPSAPEQAWRITADQLLGAGSDRAGISIEAESGDVLVVSSYAEPYSPTATLAAVNADSGEQIWSATTTGRWQRCDVGGDDVVACTKNIRDRGEIVSRVHFFDLRSGRELSRQTIHVRGPVTVAAVGDGFVAAATRDDELSLIEERLIPDPIYDRAPDASEVAVGETALVGYSGSGDRSWSTTVPAGRSTLRSAAGSRVVAMEGDRAAGFSIYRVDTGAQVYSSADPVPEEEYAHNAYRKYAPSYHGLLVWTSGDIPESYVLFDGGFAIDSASEPTVRFYDETGHHGPDLPGWTLITNDFEPMTIDRDRVPVEEWITRRFAVASGRSGELLWSRDDRADVVERISDGELAVATDDFDAADVFFRTWRVVDADTGSEGRALVTRFGRSLLGYDGRRLIFAGAPDAQQEPNIPRLSAFDGRSAAQRWEIEPVHDYSATWERAGRGLYLVGAAGYGPGWISRYAD